MEIRTVMTVALILVGCGSLGLLAVRLSNPLLKGLGWLSASFLAGATGIILISLLGRIPYFFSSIAGNCLLLFSYTLANAAVLELTDSETRFSAFSVGLLIFTFLKDLVFTYWHNSHTVRVETGGLIFAAQTMESVFYLVRSKKKGIEAPVWYTMIVFTCFAAFNLLRTAMVALHGTSESPFTPGQLQLFGVMVFLAAGLGGCFGLFWMATAKLRFSLERLAATDALTGVDNRRTFELTCEKERSRSVRSGEVFSLLFADIDHFKQVNDRFGHQAGDAVICAIVNSIQLALRASDTLGRWGGEEFVLLLPACPLEAALETAERLRESIAGLSIPLPGTEIRISISFGAASFQGEHDLLEDVFHRADAALYLAKAKGRNRVCSIEQSPMIQMETGEHRTKVAL